MTSWASLACGHLLLQDCIDVVYFAQPLKERDEVQQLCVGHVVEPRGHGHLVDRWVSSAAVFFQIVKANFMIVNHKIIFISGFHLQYKDGVCRSKVSHTYCIVGVKNVGGGGVVYDDDLSEVATQAAQVLDVVAPVKDAGLAKQSATESPPLIQEVRNRVCILWSNMGWLNRGARGWVGWVSHLG